MIETRVWIYFTLNLIFITNASPPCGLYGQPPCKFLPAMPGCTPSCAGPGDTYCEKVKDYPGHVIKSLLQRIDFHGMIIDETFDEFVSYTKTHTEYHQSYGPPLLNFVPPLPSPTQGPNIDGGYTYGPRTHYGETSSFSQSSSRDAQVNYIFGPQRQGRYYNHNNINGNNQYYRNRNRRSVIQAAQNATNGSQSPHTGSAATHLNDTTPVTNDKSRTKRQIAFGREQLCQVRTQFVNPQAALNTQGNWMYVINQGQQATQLVKTEVCASSICSNLCQPPNGYNSRCEQKYVQKRLVALETSGQRLYTDTFWFPSCCVCTLSNQSN